MTLRSSTRDGGAWRGGATKDAAIRGCKVSRQKELFGDHGRTVGVVWEAGRGIWGALSREESLCECYLFKMRSVEVEG